MGFNNVGADQAAAALQGQTIRTVLGINIGKTKVVPNEQAVEDYLHSFRTLYPYAHYFTVNVSSPNTPGLRALQDREPLAGIAGHVLSQANEELAIESNEPVKPLLLKIAPDLNPAQLDDIISIVQETNIHGLIATNTTIARQDLRTSSQAIDSIGNGGLSGAPLTETSRSIVKTLYQGLGGSVPIIGVGGVMNGADAWAMLRAGASLVQVYTGFVYGGPAFVRQLNRYLCQRMSEEGIGSIQEIVGADAAQ